MFTIVYPQRMASTLANDGMELALDVLNINSPSPLPFLFLVVKLDWDYGVGLNVLLTVSV